MIQRLKPKLEFSRNVLTLMTGTTIAQAIPIIATPFITRLFSPDEIGVYGYVVVVIVLLSTIVTLRYDQALVLAKNEVELIALKNLSLIATAFFSIIFALLLFLVDLIWFDSKYILFVIPIFFIIALSGIVNTLISFFNYKKNYSVISYNISYASITNTSSNLILGYFIGGSITLVVSLLLSKFLSLILAARKMKNELVRKTSKLKLSCVAKKYRDMPKFSTPEALLGGLNTQANFIFIGLYDIKMAGAYFIVNRLLGAPISVFSSSYSKVFYQKFTNLELENRRQYLKKTWLKLFIATFPFFIILFLSADLLTYLLGPDWAITVELFSVLLPYFFFSLIASSTGAAHLTLRLQHIALLFAVATIIFKFSIFLTGISNDIDLVSIVSIVVLYDIAQIVFMNTIAYKRT